MVPVGERCIKYSVDVPALDAEYVSFSSSSPLNWGVRSSPIASLGSPDDRIGSSGLVLSVERALEGGGGGRDGLYGDVTQWGRETHLIEEGTKSIVLAK